MDPIQSNRPSSSDEETRAAGNPGTGTGGLGAPAAHQQRAEEASQGMTDIGAGPDARSSTGADGSGHAGSAQAGDFGRSLGSASSSGSSGRGAGEGSASGKDPLADRAREVAEQLKPVALAAEEMAVKAVDLSAKGLNRLSAYLEKRRQERQSAPPSTQRPEDV